jgi:cell volume regulation protein A
MAYLLVTILLGFYQSEVSFNREFIELIFLNPIVGAISGFLFFKLFKVINDKVKLDFQGLYPALTIGFLFLTYSLATRFDGNGFLAVYIFAIKLGNAKILHKNALVDFFDGVAWLSQIGLFITLGLLVFPSRLFEIAPQAIVVSLFLIFVGRPISVMISTLFSSMNFKSKVFISWAGLKGATPIAFASFVATNVGTEANLIFDIVFFSVITSAILQGTTLKFFAKKLNLLFEAVYDPEFPVDLETLNQTKHGIKEVLLNDGDFAVSKRIVDIKLPDGIVILFIKRSGGFIIPCGSTELQSNDKVLIATPEKEQLSDAVSYFIEEKFEENILEFSKAETLSEEESNISTEDKKRSA